MSEQRNVTDTVPEPVPDTAPDAAPGAAQHSEPEPQPQPEPQPEPEPQGEPAAAPGPVRKMNRRTLALVSAAVGVVVLAGAGLAGAAALADADRTSPTRYWIADDHTTKGSQAPVPPVPPNELTGKLLPLPASYWPGPDIDVEGNYYYVPSEKALQSFTEGRTGLSSAERNERDKVLADLKLKGLAGRSYARRDGKGSAIAEIQLVQADPQQLAKFAESAKKFLDLTGADGEAPKVDGYPQAKCALDSLGGEEDKKVRIDALDCVALEGDVLVTFRMYGSAGFAVKDAAGLFKQQLDHLKSPGESA